MAALPVTLSGTLYDLYQRTTQQVVFIGDASLTGVGVGGGPIVPPDQGGGGGQPPQPSHPIYNPGGPPGSSPPGFWGGGMGPGVKPQPPDESTKPPEPVQPPIEWKAVWHPEQGWVVVGIPQGPHPAPSS